MQDLIPRARHPEPFIVLCVLALGCILWPLLLADRQWWRNLIPSNQRNTP